MHAQGADEVAFEQPEGFGQQQRAGHLDSDAVDDLAPEFERHQRVEILLRKRIFGARGDRSTCARQRKPEPLHVALGQHHRRVEADDREAARDVQDHLHDMLADARLRVVKLRGIVPGEGGAVIAVVHEARGAVAMVADAESDGGVGLVVVVVLNLDLDAGVSREIGAVEHVGREGTFRAREEPLRVFNHPLGVDAHVVRHHVTGKPQSGAGSALAQVLAGCFAAEVFGDGVILKRVGRRHRVRIAA